MSQNSVKPTANQASKKLYEFGPFRLDPAEGRLLRDGQPVPLTPKAFEVLLLLVQHRGQLVYKEKLMESVWADSFVEENNVKVTVSMLRKALEEGAEGNRYIETIPRKGHRLAADVKEIIDDGRDGKQMAFILRCDKPLDYSCYRLKILVITICSVLWPGPPMNSSLFFSAHRHCRRQKNLSTRCAHAPPGR